MDRPVLILGQVIEMEQAALRARDTARKGQDPGEAEAWQVARSRRDLTEIVKRREAP